MRTLRAALASTTSLVPTPACTDSAVISVRLPETGVRHQPKSLYGFNRFACTTPTEMAVRFRPFTQDRDPGLDQSPGASPTGLLSWAGALAWAVRMWTCATVVLPLAVAFADTFTRGARWVRPVRVVSDWLTLPIVRRAVDA